MRESHAQCVKFSRAGLHGSMIECGFIGIYTLFRAGIAIAIDGLEIRLTVTMIRVGFVALSPGL
jgi:hypothetical protein